jgi:hypothetical protein
MAWAPADIYI